MDNLFIRNVDEWVDALSPNHLPTSVFGITYRPECLRPIIGETRHPIRLALWRRAYRIANWPLSFVKVHSYEDDAYATYALSEFVERKIDAASPQKIYDPNWVQPETCKPPRTMTWGWATPQADAAEARSDTE